MENFKNYLSSIFILAFLLTSSMTKAEEILVKSYYGKYDVGTKEVGVPAKSLNNPLIQKWISPTPKKNYHIGVMFPHLEDSFWITANYGIISHAKKIGVKITLYSAGGYIFLGNQRSHLIKLQKEDNVDGIILASVAYKKMDGFVQEVNDKGVPVIALINDIHAPSIKAKSVVSSYDIGYMAGEFVVKDSKNKDIKVAVFPGPKRSGWADEQYKGFVSAISELKKSNQKITLSTTKYGDTRPSVQALRIKYGLGKHHNIDYVVGNAIAAIEAVKYLEKNRDTQPNAKIVSTYITDVVYEHIKEGSIKAAPSAQIISQCKVALDMMIRLLNGEEAGKDFPFLTTPIIPIITAENITQFNYEKLFGKRNFNPIFKK
ncbi:MAG: TMAO reductase system periplasmic protein TorT [Desulfobacterales bacterium]|nr:TMAO reductase system periplasmic protein TorT [Desulfobacterales bacterium]